MVSWIHFGDLHISNQGEQNQRDFVRLIEEANRFLREGIAFGLLPGDNADDGEADQYELVRGALTHCALPIHAITGDHDKVSGNLHAFHKCFPEALPRSFTLGDVHFVLLNSVFNFHPPTFGLGAKQLAWLRDDLAAARGKGLRSVVFMHAYPSEHAEAAALKQLFFDSGVALVEMGHTHYNELANDGRTIYAATRSTGQVEEGPVGFSVSTVDGGVVSWTFKPMGRWPLVMVTSPSDQRMIIDPTDPAQVVRGTVEVRARVWGEGIQHVTMCVDGGAGKPLHAIDGCTWGAQWDSAKVADGSHDLSVTATNSSSGVNTETVTVWVSQNAEYRTPERHAVDYENTAGAWREKHILGTELGPNENGRHWPSRHEAERAAR